MKGILQDIVASAKKTSPIFDKFNKVISSNDGNICADSAIDWFVNDMLYLQQKIDSYKFDEGYGEMCFINETYFSGLEP